MFAGSLSGQFLLCLGQAMVVACLCFDMVRPCPCPGPAALLVASTAFRTLAVPSILVTGISVLVDAVFSPGRMSPWALGWDVIFRWRNDTDEDNWWKGKGKKLARWARKQLAPRPALAPAIG